MGSSSNSNFILSKFKELEDDVLLQLLTTETKKDSFTLLKQYFEKEICSKRKYDRIHNFEDLFEVLKKRDQLSYDKLEPFKIVAVLIGNKNLTDRIIHLEEQFRNFRTEDDLLLYENGKFPSSTTCAQKESICRLQLKEREQSQFFSNEDRTTTVTRNNSFLENTDSNPEDISLLDCQEKGIIMGQTADLYKLSVKSLPTDEAEKSSVNCNTSVMTRSERRKRCSLKLIIISAFLMTLLSMIWSQIVFSINYDLICPIQFTAISSTSEERKQKQVESFSGNVTTNFLTSSQTEFHSQRNNPGSSRSGESAIQKSVIDRISHRIGNKWRDLARYLDVEEADIDAIDTKYHGDLKEKAYQALRFGLSQYKNKQWKLELMRALEQARRKDLRDWIEEYYHSRH